MCFFLLSSIDYGDGFLSVSLSCTLEWASPRDYFIGWQRVKINLNLIRIWLFRTHHLSHINDYFNRQIARWFFRLDTKLKFILHGCFSSSSCRPFKSMSVRCQLPVICLRFSLFFALSSMEIYTIDLPTLLKPGISSFSLLSIFFSFLHRMWESKT